MNKFTSSLTHRQHPKQLLLLLCFTISFLLGGFAQSSNWSFKGYGPSFRHINAVQILSSGRIIAAGGWPSNDSITSIFLSNDNATTWEIRQDFVNAMIQDIHFPSPNIGYAVGDWGKILKTNDAGVNWTQTALTGNLATRTFRGVYFIDDLIGVAVGGRKANDSIQTIIRTVDGGANWTIITDNIGSMLQDVSFISPTKGFAVGNNGKMLYTQDAGLTWAPFAFSGTMANRDFYGVQFTNLQVGVVVGGTNKIDTTQTIIRTTDGGQTWNVIVDTIAPMLRTICFSTANEVYVGGDKGTIRYSYTQGTSWATQTVVGNDNLAINDIHFRTPLYGIAAGQSGKILIYYDSLNNPPSAILASPPTIVNANSVSFSGDVTSIGSQSTVELEYGTSATTFSNTLAMTPSSVTGSHVPVSVTVTGLLANTLYYARIKATNPNGIAYSTILPFYTSILGIPNFDFENWHEFSYDLLQDWETAGLTQRVASYNGSYAVKLKASANLSPGVMVHANVTYNGGPIIHPLPYNSGKPDTLMFYAKYDIEANDTAIVKVTFKTGNIETVNQTYKMYGSSAGIFQQIKMPIQYSAALTPDSLSLLILSTNYFATGNVSAISELTVDNITFIGASSQLLNYDIEDWFIGNRSQADLWYSQDDSGYDPLSPSMVQKSTDAYHGNNALLLKNKQSANQFAALYSGLTSGSPKPHFPVKAKHNSLQGFYKFQQDANDTLFMYVTMYYQGSQIGYGFNRVTNSYGNYTPFNAPISYTTTDTPDSASISIYIHKASGTPGDSWALIDYLTFDGLTGIAGESVSDKGRMQLYPNPAKDKLTVDLSAMQDLQDAYIDLIMYDMMGREVFRQTVPTSPFIQVDISSLPAQSYILTVHTSQSPLLSKFIKIQ